MQVTQSAERVQSFCKSVTTVLLKRLPIYDQDKNVFAYELMPYTRKSEYVDDEAQRADLLVNSIVNFDFDELVGDSKVLIPISELLLHEVENMPFNKERVIYGLPNECEYTSDNVELINGLMRQGHQFSMTLSRDLVEEIERFPNVSLIKLDASQYNTKNIQTILTDKKHNFIMSNIKTHEEFDYFCNVGFKYCQGYFFFFFGCLSI